MHEAQIDPPVEEQREAQIQAVVRGEHRDPFSFLGPHETIVRAWLPQAREVVFLDCDDSLTPMQQGPTGFFTVTVPEPTRDYRFRATLYSGESVDLDDPYRFPPLLTPSICTCTGKARTTKAIAPWGRTWRSARAWRGRVSRYGLPTRRW